MLAAAREDTAATGTTAACYTIAEPSVLALEIQICLAWVDAETKCFASAAHDVHVYTGHAMWYAHSTLSHRLVG